MNEVRTSYSPDDVGRANHDLIRRTERLAAAMREFETLSLAVAHDFQAPLDAIDGTARAMGEGGHALHPSTAQGVLAIRENVAAMQAMIGNLLELCHVAGKPMELEPTDMEALTRAAWAGIENSERVEFNLGKLPVVQGHRGMLELVWANLLSGAARRSRRHPRPSVEVTGGESGEFAVYSVSDNGTGLDLDYTGKLFYAFEQLQKQSDDPGTGVGLAIVQRIVTRHRGHVWVEARRQKGAIFQFSLPIGINDP
jgi:light-regulated signal transduction histidine kinase (bacteriophytochrome)